MKYFLLGLSIAVLSALAFVFPAKADLIAKQGADYLLLREDGACLPALLEQFPEEYRTRAYPAEAMVDGKKYVGCWVQVGDVAGLLYEDGDIGQIPMELLTPYVGV